jgi:hypothetical protein
MPHRNAAILEAVSAAMSYAAEVKRPTDAALIGRLVSARLTHTFRDRRSAALVTLESQMAPGVAAVQHLVLCLLKTDVSADAIREIARGRGDQDRAAPDEVEYAVRALEQGFSPYEIGVVLRLRSQAHPG